jgi:hypothetical protein
MYTVVGVIQGMGRDMYRGRAARRSWTQSVKDGVGRGCEFWRIA